jgi:hypothetical protein
MASSLLFVALLTEEKMAENRRKAAGGGGQPPVAAVLIAVLLATPLRLALCLVPVFPAAGTLLNSAAAATASVPGATATAFVGSGILRLLLRLFCLLLLHI